MTVSISIPGDGSALKGTVTVTVKVAPTKNLRRIDLFVDGVKVASSLPTASWAYQWDTTAVSDGTHTLRADAVYSSRTSSASLGVTVTNTVTPPPPPAPGGGGTFYNVPDSINRTGTADATAALQSWIDGVPDGTALNPSILRFIGGTYRIDSQLTLTSRSYLTFEFSSNTTVQWNTPDDDSRRLFALEFCTGVVFRNGTLLGTYTYPASGDAFVAAFQHMHAISVDVSNVGVQNMSISGFFGDGVDFTSSHSGSATSSGYVRASDIRKVGRNCISVVAADGININSANHFQQAGFVGIDLEPNAAQTYFCKNVVVDGNTWGGQVGTTQRVLFRILSSDTVPVTDVQFSNNTIVGRSFGTDINITGTQGSRVARVTMNGNTCDTSGAGELWQLKQTDGLSISGNTIPVSSGVSIGVYDSTNVSITGSTFTIH